MANQQIQAPKFAIDQRVKFIKDNDGEAGLVKSFSYDRENGWTYSISARELDIPNKQVVEGIKHCRENELVTVEEKAAPQPEVQEEEEVVNE